MTNTMVIEEVRELRSEVRTLAQVVKELVEKINRGIFVDTTKNSPHALDMLVDLGKKLEPVVEKRGITEAQLIKDLRKTRKEIFKEVYGDIAH